MTNTNLTRNVFPPKSLFCYEAQRVLERKEMFAPIRLYQKCLRISLVRAIDKLSLFINKNLTLATNYHTIQIQRARRKKPFLVKYHFNVMSNSLV